MEQWRRVEVAACEEMEGPSAAELEAIRAASFTVEAVAERERVTDHDVAAFVDVLSASAGPAGRWIHYGLTSSDVLDTALALTLRDAGEIVVAGARELTAALVGTRPRAHRDARASGAPTACTPSRRPSGSSSPASPSRRTATRSGSPPPSTASRSARSRGRSAPTRRPRRSSSSASSPGSALRPRGRRDAGRGTRPPRRAARRDRARRGRARAARDRDPPPPAHRGARGGGAVSRRRAEGLLVDAAQAQPDHQRADQRPRAGAARQRLGGARERRAVARARHLALRAPSG